MHRRKARGRVTGGACFLVPLIAGANLGADPIPFASRSDQLEIDPTSRFRTRVSPEFGFLAEHRYDNVQFSVAVKVANDRSPMRTWHREGGSRGRRAVRKRAVALIDKQAIGLFVTVAGE